MHWHETVGLFYCWTLQNVPIISRNASSKSCTELNFLQKTLWTHISIWLRSGTRGYKHLRFWNIIMHWNEEIHFVAERCKKYRLYRNMLQTKVTQNKICYKKLNGRISLSTPGVELGGYKDLRFWNIIMHWNEKVHFRAECYKEYRLYRKML